MRDIRINYQGSTPYFPSRPIGKAMPRANPRMIIPATRVRIFDENKDSFGFARNISSSGMLVQTVRLCKVDEVINIEFELPSLNLNIKCRSKVVWREEPNWKTSTARGGLKFLDLDLSAADKIENWIQGTLNN
jgi:PilZ domain